MDQFPKFNIFHKIIAINEKEHQIIVRYWTDFLSQEELASDTNRNEDGTPCRCRTDSAFNIWDNMKTETEIEEYIARVAPIEWFKLQYKGKYPEQFSSESVLAAKNLLHREYVREIDPNAPTMTIREDLSESEIESLLNKLTTV